MVDQEGHYYTKFGYFLFKTRQIHSKIMHVHEVERLEEECLAYISLGGIILSIPHILRGLQDWLRNKMGKYFPHYKIYWRLISS